MSHPTLRGRVLAVAIAAAVLLLPLTWAQASPLFRGDAGSPAVTSGLLGNAWHLVLQLLHLDGASPDGPRPVTSVQANGGPCIDPDGHTIEGCVNTNAAGGGGGSTPSSGGAPGTPLVR